MLSLVEAEFRPPSGVELQTPIPLRSGGDGIERQ